MTKEAFLKQQMVGWAVEQLTAQLSNSHWEADKVVVAYIKQHRPTDYQDNRNWNIQYYWRDDGIDVGYQPEKGIYGQWDEEPQMVWFKLKYQDVFGWTVDWDAPAGGVSQVITHVAEILKGKARPVPALDYSI